MKIERIKAYMICEECKKLGLKSTISVRHGCSTCMGVHSFYDESGMFHIHDPNVTIMEYTCSNGHEITEKKENKCWCEENELDKH